MAATPLERYLGGLTVTQGRRAGEAFTVLPWERRFVRGAFGPGVQSAALSVARGNGKTAFIERHRGRDPGRSADGSAWRDRDRRQRHIQQGRIIVRSRHAAFLGDKTARPEALGGFGIRAQVASIENRATGARVRVLGSDPRRAHGQAPVLVLADEPAQWPESTGERMVSALLTSRRETTVVPHGRAQHAARCARSLVWKDACGRRGLCAVPRGPAGGCEVSAPDVGQG